MQTERFPIDHILCAPQTAQEWDAWREFLHDWRRSARAQLAYDGRLYAQSPFAWTTSCFSCAFVMLCDETFYDTTADRYTVESLLDAGRQRGGARRLCGS